MEFLKENCNAQKRKFASKDYDTSQNKIFRASRLSICEMRLSVVSQGLLLVTCSGADPGFLNGGVNFFLT